jgi:hypothetical protein
MKPSIATMLAGKKGQAPADDEGGEPGLAESKSASHDAATALASAVAAKDADGIYRAFRSLSTLCRSADDLEESGESEEEEPSAPPSAPSSEAASDEE